MKNVNRAYIGKARTGKTTKLLEDIKDLKLTNNVLAIIEPNDILKYSKALSESKIIILNDLKEIDLKDKYTSVIIDCSDVLKIPNLDKIILPKNVFWVFQSVKQLFDVMFILDNKTIPVEIELLKSIMDEEIKKSDTCFVLDI